MECKGFSAVKKFDRKCRENPRNNGKIFRGIVTFFFLLNSVYLLTFSRNASAGLRDCLPRFLGTQDEAVKEERAIRRALAESKPGDANWDLVEELHQKLQSEIKTFAVESHVSELMAREEILNRWVHEALGTNQLERRLAIAQEWVPRDLEFRRLFLDAHRKLRVSEGASPLVRVNWRGVIQVSGRPLGSRQELIDQIFEVELRIREAVEGEYPNFKYVGQLKKVIIKDKTTGKRIRVTKILDAFADEMNRQTSLREKALEELNAALGKQVSPELLAKNANQGRLQTTLEAAEKLNHAAQRRVGAALGSAAEKFEKEGAMRTILERLDIVAKSRGLDPEKLSIAELMKDPVFKLEVQTAAYKLRYFLGPVVFLGSAYAVTEAIKRPTHAIAVVVEDHEREKLLNQLIAAEKLRKRCFSELYDLRQEESSKVQAPVQIQARDADLRQDEPSAVQAQHAKEIECSKFKGTEDAIVFKIHIIDESRDEDPSSQDQ